MRTGPGARPDHQIGLAVAREVGRRDRGPARELGGEGVKGRQRFRRPAAEHFDVRPRPGPGRSDEVGPAVAVDIAAGDVDAAGEPRVVSEETAERPRDQIAADAVVDFDVRTRPRSGRGDQVGDAVVVDVPRRHPHAARVTGRERLPLEDEFAGLGIVSPHERRGPGGRSDENERQRQRPTVGGDAVFEGRQAGWNALDPAEGERRGGLLKPLSQVLRMGRSTSDSQIREAANQRVNRVERIRIRSTGGGRPVRKS